MEMPAEDRYEDRVRRVLAAVRLEVPDRVPVVSPIQAFPYYWAGVSIRDAMNDYALARRVCHRFVDEFRPDLDFGPIFMYPARAMEILGLRWFRWAGNGLGDNVMYQFVEGEYMKGEEYDEFLYDPSHFMASKWLPRSFEGLRGMAGFPPMRSMMWFGWTGLLAGLADPAVQEALRCAAEAGAELRRWFDSISLYGDEIRAKGFPQAYASFSWPPFDIVGDTLRGTRGIMTDMIRRPDKLLAAVDKATQLCIDYGAPAAGADVPFCWIWMHKGSEGFMSGEQYRRFYWPFLKRAIEGLVARGVIPIVYCEGDDTSRLDCFAEVPPGKVVFHFATMDMARAKSVLRGIACISGNVPNRLMLTGSPEDVRDCCKKLIDVCGAGGGYIMDTSALLDEARPENVRMMFEFTREYGVYR